MKRFLSFLTRRELLLVSLTAAVCFAIAIPMSGAATHAQTPVTVAPDTYVVFPNLDWACYSSPKSKAINRDGIPVIVPARVECYRANNASDLTHIVGKLTSVTPHQIWVLRCTDGVANCPTLGKWKRNP